MATFRFELNNKPTRNKKYSVLLCVSVGGKRKRLTTPIQLDKQSQFNSKCKGDNWVRASVPDAAAWNKQLHDILEDAKRNYQELSSMKMATSSGVIRNIKQGEESVSFIEYAKEKNLSILNAGGFHNWRKHTTALNKLESFIKKQGKDDLLFTELTPEFLTRFDGYLSKLRNQRHPDKVLHRNSIEAIFRDIRSLVVSAIKEGKMKEELNPFRVFKFSGVKTEKEKLTHEELERLLALDLVEGSLLWHTRNYFFFSMYCAGIRASDLIKLRWRNIYKENGDMRIKYQMGKNHKPKDLVLVAQAKSILRHYWREDCTPDDFIFPLMDKGKPFAGATTQAEFDTMPIELKKAYHREIGAKTALINKYLKKLAKMAVIEKTISTHIARHSFANAAMHKNTGNAIIKNLMAHSSVATTEKYMGNFNQTETDNALRQIFAEDTMPTDPRSKLAMLIAGLSDEDVSKLLNTLATSTNN